jgi:hypothetical protein
MIGGSSFLPFPPFNGSNSKSRLKLITSSKNTISSNLF